MIADEEGVAVEAIKAWGNELMSWWQEWGLDLSTRNGVAELLTRKNREIPELGNKTCVCLTSEHGLELANDDGDVHLPLRTG